MSEAFGDRVNLETCLSGSSLPPTVFISDESSVLLISENEPLRQNELPTNLAQAQALTSDVWRGLYLSLLGHINKTAVCVLTVVLLRRCTGFHFR